MFFKTDGGQILTLNINVSITSNNSMFLKNILCFFKIVNLISKNFFLYILHLDQANKQFHSQVKFLLIVLEIYGKIEIFKHRSRDY